MNKFIKSSVIAFLAVTIMFGLTGSAKAVTATVDLGDAGRFVILSGAGITDVPGTSTITGNIGVSPAAGTTITGIIQSQVTGSIYTVAAAGPAGNVVDPTLLTSAKTDLTAAYTDAANRTPVIKPTELGSTTLYAGVYASDATTFDITGTLTLDGQDDPNAVFIFQAPAVQASSLTVNSGSIVALTNGASACNVFWVVGGATINTGATFKGNILSNSAITVANGSDIEGRLLAETNVTLDTDTITVGVCAASYTPSTDTATTTTALPSTGNGNSNSNNTMWLYLGIGTVVIIGLITFLVTRKKKDIPQQPQQQ